MRATTLCINGQCNCDPRGIYTEPNPLTPKVQTVPASQPGQHIGDTLQVQSPILEITTLHKEYIIVDNL